MPELANLPNDSLRIAAYVFFPAGGIGRYTSEWAAAMNKRSDAQATVLCAPDFVWKNSERYEAWSGLRPLSHPIPARRRARFLSGQLTNPRIAIRYAREQQMDVLHLSNINHLSFPLWKRALDRSGLVVTATVHDVRRQTAVLHRGWETRQLQAFYRYADALFVHSAYQRDDLLDFAGGDPERIHIVPHGPYPYAEPSADPCTLRRRYGLPEDRQVALCFGQLRDQKNLEGLLEAVAVGTHDVHLFVAGNAPNGHLPHQHYHARAEALGIADRVTFLPRYIADEEVPDVFAVSDWVALPYHADFTSQSGVLNVAVHYRRPVLVAEAPVLRETVEVCDIGVVAPSDSVDGLGEGIGRIMERVNQGDAFAFKSYRKQYSWEENARRSVDVFRTLVEANKGP